MSITTRHNLDIEGTPNDGSQTEAANSTSHARNGSNGHASKSLRIWGLLPQELHDAYWLSRGVQCVRLGLQKPIDPDADFYLLIEPDQLVLLDIDEVIGRLIWQGASVTHLQLVDDSLTYRESAVVDGEGFLQRIERRYASTARPRHRVRMTDRRGIAERWAASTSVRAWRMQLRRVLRGPLVDRIRCGGRCFAPGCQHAEAAFLTELVERWHDPERVLEGLDVLHNGVRKHAAEPKPSGTMVGPIWLGFSHRRLTEVTCLVGPAWLPDDSGNGSVTNHRVHVRCLRDIEMPTPLESEDSLGGHRHRHTMSFYLGAKRALDIVVSAGVLVALMPIMLIVAAAIIVDDGWPVLFRHRRQSRHGRPFDCLKFRTMAKNAETMVSDLSSQNLCDGPQVNIENDPRVTRVGRILRRFHLDELPQFWNVLTGDMSLVGPRPSPDAENRICPAWREMRLSVRPGITGLWQVNRTRKPGRDFQEWIRYDVEYVRQASFWLDVRICVRTALMILFGSRPK